MNGCTMRRTPTADTPLLAKIKEKETRALEKGKPRARGTLLNNGGLGWRSPRAALKNAVAEIANREPTRAKNTIKTPERN